MCAQPKVYYQKCDSGHRHSGSVGLSMRRRRAAAGTSPGSRDRDHPSSLLVSLLSSIEQSQQMAAAAPTGADVSALAHALCAALLRVPVNEEPRLAAGLRAGASADALAACEAALGVALPAPLRALLLVLDGQEYDPRVSAMPGAPWSRLLPCSAIAERFQALPDILAMCEEEFAVEMPEGEHALAADHRVGAPGCPVVAYNSHWLPFAEA